MNRFYLSLCLWPLLVIAQLGAVLHGINHIPQVSRTDVNVSAEARAPLLNNCELCAAFAQLPTPTLPAVSYCHVVPATTESSSDPAYAVLATEVPAPRSRGPPAVS
jgi:hypothetical protein